jgi:hypothetical protein
MVTTDPRKVSLGPLEPPSRRTGSPSPRAFRLIWPPFRSAATVVLLVALALVLFPALALASPTDPLWIGGLYDAGDWDDAVLASASRDGVAGATGPKDLRTSWIAVGMVQLGWSGPPTRLALPAFDGRAPPAACRAWPRRGLDRGVPLDDRSLTTGRLRGPVADRRLTCWDHKI